MCLTMISSTYTVCYNRVLLLINARLPQDKKSYLFNSTVFHHLYLMLKTKSILSSSIEEPSPDSAIPGAEFDPFGCESAPLVISPVTPMIDKLINIIIT